MPLFKSNNIIAEASGSELLKRPIYLVVLAFVVMFLAIAVSKNFLFTVAGLVGLPGGIAYILIVFKNPRIGAWSLLVYSFVWSLIARYLFAYTGIGFQFGLGVDGLLALSLVAMLFSGGFKAPYANLRNGMVFLSLLWFFFIFLQLFNPNASSMIAWIFTVRSYAFYLIGSVIICNMLLNQREDFDTFLLIFIGFSIFGALYGMRQLHIGLDFVDSIFIRPKLDRHMLFGKLRVFSFYENAGQAGVSQGHAMVVATVMLFHEKRRNYWIFYLVGSLLCAYGMAISGTRGALAVPIVGLGVYLFWCKRVWITVSGMVIGGMAMFLLLFTTVGQSNYTINRMRTAFDPNDPSYQYRLEAREHYSDYMNKHPFGWGLGSAGYWGNRFAGDDNVMTGTDGGYVQLQAEIGYMGLYIYWGFYAIALGATFLMLFQYREDPLYAQVLALCCGMIGLLVANYGNSVIYQLPSNIIVSYSLAYIWMARRWSKGESFEPFESRFM